MEPLNDSNFLLYAAKNYNNPQCYDTAEFYDDLKKIKYIRRLFNSYAETGEIRERLILNHLITLYNVFGPEATTRILFLKLPEYHSFLKPFLELLTFLPDQVILIGLPPETLNTLAIPSDETIQKKLKGI